MIIIMMIMMIMMVMIIKIIIRGTPWAHFYAFTLSVCTK